MARKRKTSRRTRRNPKYAVMRNKRRRRLRKNQYVETVVVPVIAGSLGFVAARYLGNMIAMRDLGTTDPKVGKTIAAGIGIPVTYAVARRMPTGYIAKNTGPIVLGMGLGAVESWIRDTKLLGGSGAAAVVAESSPAPAAVTDEATASAAPDVDEVIESGDGTSGFGAYYETAMTGLADYYNEGMLGGLGADPADQNQIDKSMDSMESSKPKAVSTVIPTDMALPAHSMPQFAQVREQFASGDKGHAGGMFARHLFSGMMGG